MDNNEAHTAEHSDSADDLGLFDLFAQAAAYTLDSVRFFTDWHGQRHYW